MTSQHLLDIQKQAYARWAPIYDKVYNRFLSDAHRRTAEAAAKDGGRILEVGVGTGLVLRYYPQNVQVTGIDLSEAMLRKAQEKATHLAQVSGIAAMDACRLGFSDASFDGVAVPFVITLVPDPEGALDEALRVLKPGGILAVSSKLGPDQGAQARIEDAIGPLMKRMGWSSDFKISRITNWAEKRGLDIEGIDPLFPAGFFKLIRMRKR
jgi:phosphatidylethanolamine/phosphatidyl-N-methylethanolamine N-methyltransferase